jgi:hypothetical protein
VKKVQRSNLSRKTIDSTKDQVDLKTRGPEATSLI